MNEKYKCIKCHRKLMVNELFVKEEGLMSNHYCKDCVNKPLIEVRSNGYK